MVKLLTDIENTYSSLSNWDSLYPTDYTDNLFVIYYLSKIIETRANIVLCII